MPREVKLLARGHTGGTQSLHSDCSAVLSPYTGHEGETHTVMTVQQKGLWYTEVERSPGHQEGCHMDGKVQHGEVQMAE